MWFVFWPALVFAASAAFGTAHDQIRTGCNLPGAKHCESPRLRLEDIRRKTQRALEGDLQKAAIERLSWTTVENGVTQTHNYTIGIAEFDDQGRAWDSDQIEAVKDALSQTLARRNALVVTFIHGWKNNCEACNGNLACFRESLALLAAAEHRLAAQLTAIARQQDPAAPAQPPREVFGVYVAWRGQSTRTPIAKELSYFDRKPVADRIGSARGGDVTNLLAWVTQQRNAGAPQQPSVLGDMLAFVGHSFGADVLFGAVANTLDAHIAAADGGRRPVQPFGDVLVLVNPAFEASAYTRFAEYAKQSWPDGQLPLMLTVQARNDRPTSLVFPVARSVTTLGQSSGRDGYGAMLSALGHYAPFFTHELTRRADMTTVNMLASMTGMTPPRNEPAADQLGMLVEQMVRRDDGDRCACNGTRATEASLKTLTDSILGIVASMPEMPQPPNIGDPLVGTLSSMRPCGPANLDSPFLVIRADQDVVDGHSGITRLELFDFLANFILRTQQIRAPGLFAQASAAMKKLGVVPPPPPPPAGACR